jgi:hypothetical protein
MPYAEAFDAGESAIRKYDLAIARPIREIRETALHLVVSSLQSPGCSEAEATPNTRKNQAH